MPNETSGDTLNFTSSKLHNPSLPGMRKKLTTFDGSSHVTNTIYSLRLYRIEYQHETIPQARVRLTRTSCS